jgi:hypothetical protein
VTFLAKLLLAWVIVRDRTVPARRVRPGDDVLELGGWRRVVGVDVLRSGGVAIRFAEGLRYSHARAPFRVRRTLGATDSRRTMRA